MKPGKERNKNEEKNWKSEKDEKKEKNSNFKTTFNELLRRNEVFLNIKKRDLKFLKHKKTKLLIGLQKQVFLKRSGDRRKKYTKCLEH